MTILAQHMEIEPEHLGEIHPANTTFERFCGPLKTVQTRHLQRIRCFLNTPILDP